MIELKELEGQGVYTFTINENIDVEDVEDFYDLLMKKSKNGEHIRLLGVVNKFPSFENIQSIVEVMKVKIKALKAIGKYAVLSDNSFLESMFPIGNAVIPGIPLKLFKPEEREKAITWLQMDQETNEDNQKLIKDMQLKKIEGTNIFSFVVDGKVSKAGMDALHGILKIQNKAKVDLLAEIKEFDGFENIGSFFKSIQADISALAHVNKYAILTDKGWIEKLAKAENFIVPGIHIQTFHLDQREEAMKWLKEK